MNLQANYISQAEKKWLKPLYEYCQTEFDKVRIPSHDHTHHIRVWEYTKEILQALSNKYPISYDLVEGCIISSIFHDLGLTKTLNENHGEVSKNICIQYFEEHKLNKPYLWKEILFAIEKHDDKNYKVTKINPKMLLSILCTADDLDAFGNIGVLRYTEIYLLRGISLTNLPQLVIQNLDKRFLNFEKTYGNYPQLFAVHKKRYLITREFFENTSDELNDSALSS